MRLRPVRPGYTLVEILIATTLALMLMAAVSRMFGQLGTSVNNSRAILETADRLRAAAIRLQLDLDNVTVTMSPPRRVEANEGYFELIDACALFPPATVSTSGTPYPYNVSPAITQQTFFDSTNNFQPDSSFVYTDASKSSVGTVGLMGHILMFTVRDSVRPFTGRCASSPTGTIQSDTAEVAWFIRGHNLHRRVMLVAPGVTLTGAMPSSAFYGANDISVHQETRGGSQVLVPNTLGDLTRRECRFAHPLDKGFPYDASRWGQLCLPTLCECASLTWQQCNTPPASLPRPLTQMDLWSSNPNYFYTDYELLGGPTATPNYPRLADDVILTNCIGVDVKVWDPGAGAYVDLGSGTNGWFGGYGNQKSWLASNPNVQTYDSGSTSSEAVNGPTKDIVSGQKIVPGQSFNGLDDNNTGIVDNANPNITNNDLATVAPYPVPMRGIQIKIRVFEPESRTIREVTVIEDFIPK